MGPQHPFADQFPNRLAWRFEKTLRAGARDATGPESLQRYIATVTDMLQVRNPEWATAWRVFVDRKLADLPWPALPEQVHAVTTTKVRHVIQGLRSSSGPTGPALDAAAVLRTWGFSETGEPAEIPQGPPFLRRAGPEIKTTRPVVGAVPGGPPVLVTERQRRPGGPIPLGWVVEHVGYWPGVSGNDTEVVYNPRRHQVMITQRLGPESVASLHADGWQRHAADGDRVLWSRDRVAATQAALTRIDQAAAIEPPAAALRSGLALER